MIMRYGKLTLLKKVGKNKRYETLWECLCDCGNIKIVKLINLKSGKTKSCGCISTGPQSEILIGYRFGRLVLTRHIGKTKWRAQVYECLCDCGNTIITNIRNLKTGNTKSCGCLKQETDNSRSGSNNPNFDPTIPESERNKRRSAPNFSAWKKAIKNRGFCEVCGTASELVAHHIESWKANPELRTEITNGACLCKKCHISFHKKYGYGNNDRNQYKSFLEWKGGKYEQA